MTAPMDAKLCREFDECAETLAWLKKTAIDKCDYSRIIGFEDCLIAWKKSLQTPSPHGTLATKPPNPRRGEGDAASRLAKCDPIEVGGIVYLRGDKVMEAFTHHEGAKKDE